MSRIKAIENANVVKKTNVLSLSISAFTPKQTPITINKNASINTKVVLNNLLNEY